MIRINLSKLKMPAVSPDGIAAMDLISSDDYNIDELSKLISRDPTLSANLLKYANSPIYNLANEVTNVNRAVSILGAKALRAAIMIATMRDFLNHDQTSTLLWEHSQAVANIAKLIAKQYFPKLADDIELAALIHDIGALVLASNLPEEYAQVAQTVLDSGGDMTLSEAEKQSFGVTHDDVTDVVITNTRLPENIKLILADFHHRPPLIDAEDIISQQTALIGLAHHLDEKINEHTQHLTETLPESLETSQTHLNLTNDEIENFLEDYDEMLMAEE